MQKVYLLLRNNTQTGPHSLEELAQLNLKPLDLVWVEGKSYGWSYPREIDVLKPLVEPQEKIDQKPEPVTFTPLYSNPLAHPDKKKSVYVSMPTGTPAAPLQNSDDADERMELEQKAAQLRKRAEAFAQSTITGDNPELKTKYSQSLGDVEETYTKWAYQHKTKKKVSYQKPTLLVTTLIVLVISAYLLWPILFQPGNANTTALLQGVQKENQIIPASVIQDEEGQVNNQESIPSKKTLIATKKKSEKPLNTPEQNKPIHVEVPVAEQALQPPAGEEDIVKTKVEETPAEEAKPKEARKTLAQKIDGFFDKLGGKKGDEEVSEKESGSTTPVNGSRKANRRNENETDSESAELTTMIDITSNQNSENWMVGITGLKITAHNRSNETVATASVEVSYFSEDGTLLDKKLILFSNIAPQKKTTLSAPDHRMADHVEFKLLSAAGKKQSVLKEF